MACDWVVWRPHSVVIRIVCLVHCGSYYKIVHEWNLPVGDFHLKCVLVYNSYCMACFEIYVPINHSYWGLHFWGCLVNLIVPHLAGTRLRLEWIPSPVRPWRLNPACQHCLLILIGIRLEYFDWVIAVDIYFEFVRFWSWVWTIGNEQEANCHYEFFSGISIDLEKRCQVCQCLIQCSRIIRITMPCPYIVVRVV